MPQSQKRVAEISFIELEGATGIVTLPDESDLRVLTGMGLRVEAGKHMSTIGRSGTGKSIMLNIIRMLDPPTAGRCTIDGIDTAPLRERRRARLQGDTVDFIFQQFNIFNARTALENVEVPLLYSNDARFWKRRELATRMLERVGLGGRVDSHPAQISGSEQQRIVIVHALARSPKIILADKPTGALNPDTDGSVTKLLETVTAENSVALLVITHDPKVAERADQILELYDGALRERRVPLLSSESRGVKA